MIIGGGSLLPILLLRLSLTTFIVGLYLSGGDVVGCEKISKSGLRASDAIAGCSASGPDRLLATNIETSGGIRTCIVVMEVEK